MKSPALLLALLLAGPGFVPAGELTIKAGNAKGGPVQDAVVSLVPLDGAVPPVAGAAPKVEIAQQGQEYTTFVTVVQAGTRVNFPNHDTVQHHVYSLSKAKKFEFPLYNPGSDASIVFDTSGVVALGCNIHDWMLAYLVVVPTPYFSKTDATGAARIAAPPGRYRLELWHPRLAAPLEQEVTLGVEPVARDFTLVLKADRRIRRGAEGKTGIYR